MSTAALWLEAAMQTLTSSMLWEMERNRLIQGFTWGLMAVLFSSLRPS